MTLIGAVQLLIPSVVAPIFVFGANWAFRYRNHYAQTAAADLLLAVVIFDIGVISVSETFAQLVSNPDFRAIVVNWHIFMGIAAAVTWWLIVAFGEPALERYYRGGRGSAGFPIGHFTACWMGIASITMSHVGFFVLQGGV